MSVAKYRLFITLLAATVIVVAPTVVMAETIVSSFGLEGTIDSISLQNITLSPATDVNMSTGAVLLWDNSGNSVVDTSSQPVYVVLPNSGNQNQSGTFTIGSVAQSDSEVVEINDMIVADSNYDDRAPAIPNNQFLKENNKKIKSGAQPMKSLVKRLKEMKLKIN